MEGMRNDSANGGSFKFITRTLTTFSHLWIYGDPAFPLRKRLECACKGAVLTDQEKAY